MITVEYSPEVRNAGVHHWCESFFHFPVLPTISFLRCNYFPFTCIQWCCFNSPQNSFSYFLKLHILTCKASILQALIWGTNEQELKTDFLNHNHSLNMYF